MVAPRFSRLRSAVVAGLAAALCGAGPATAQEVIAADRPGLDFSPLAVDPGVIQVEIGLPSGTYFSEGDASLWSIQFPTLVRVGVVDGLELRAGAQPLNILSFQGEEAGFSEAGFGDLELGAKLSLSSPEGGRPGVALIPSFTVPTGEAPFTADRPAYLLNAVATWAIDAWSVAAVGGVYSNPAGDDERVVSGMLAGVLGRSLGGRVGGFVEGGWFPVEGGGPAGLVGGGLAILLSDEIQIDFSVDRGITDDSPDWLLGAGFATRF